MGNLTAVSAEFGKGKRALLIAAAFLVPFGNSRGARVWSLVSRFTWELPQQVLGVCYAQVINLMGGVLNVAAMKGAMVVRTNFGGGMALGNIITASSAALDKHEWGHTIQSRRLGPLYLLVIGAPSFARASVLWLLEKIKLSKGISPAAYYRFYAEAWANKLADKYWDRC